MRGWRHEDLEQWAALCADDEVMRWLGYDGGLAPEEAWREMTSFAGHWVLKASALGARGASSEGARGPRRSAVSA